MLFAKKQGEIYRNVDVLKKTCYIKNKITLIKNNQQKEVKEMEGYKRIESIIKLKMLEKKGLVVLFLLFLMNVAGFFLEPSVLYEIGMLVSLVSMTYLLVDYKGY